MIDQIVGQFFQSGAGRELLQKVPLDERQARAAVQATVEGAMHHSKSEGGMESEASGLSNGTQSAGAIASQVAHFVAQRSGVAPALAQQVVSLALPKVLELIQGHSIPSPRPSGNANPIVDRVFSRH